MGWECKREHPGYLCSNCRVGGYLHDGFHAPVETKDNTGQPKEDTIEKEDGDEASLENNDYQEWYTDDEAALSESWSDGSCSSGGVRTRGYSNIFRTEVERIEDERYQQSQVDLVEAAQKLLGTVRDDELPVLTGQLNGRWYLHHPEFAQPASQACERAELILTEVVEILVDLMAISCGSTFQITLPWNRYQSL